MPCPIHIAIARWIADSKLDLPGRRIVIGFSGGLDSTVLLHAMAALPGGNRVQLAAVHVDHGLNARSADWAAHCAQVCGALGIPLHTLRVEVNGVAELGPEGAARRARYAAFDSVLDAGDVLLTAHHADDQAETLLLRALRSAGLEGMAAMRPLRALGDAWLGRPLLDVARAQIVDYARQHQLQWIEDPSNTDERLDRNFLRHQVLPLIESRWPQARRALAESARHLRAAESAARAELDRRLQAVRGMSADQLRIAGLRGIVNEEAATLIRHWLHGCGLPTPPPRVLDDLLNQLRHAQADRGLRVCWPGGELRRYREVLYALRPAGDINARSDLYWDLPATLDLGDGRHLSIAGTTPACRLQVRQRAGGERLTLAANRPRRELRLLFQEAGIPPWQRERLPYLYADTRLVAVGSHFLDLEFRQWLERHGAQLIFRDTAMETS